MKYSPTKFPFTMAAIKQKEWGWAFLAGLIEVPYATDQARKGNDVWCCGKCSSAISLRAGVIPKVCSNCGNEIDWVGIKTRVIKVCPKCNGQGVIWEKFCPLHSPAVMFVNKEIPI